MLQFATITELNNVLASESIEHKRNIDEKCRRDQNQKRHNGSISMTTRTTPKTPELDLNNVDQSHHEESTPANRAQSGDHHPESESRLVNVVHHWIDPCGEVKRRGYVEPHGLFETQSDEAGE